MICRGFPHSSHGCATCPSTTTRTGSCLRCNTIPCRTSWPPRHIWTTAPPKSRLSSPWSLGTGCWRTCRWEGRRPQAASTSHHGVCATDWSLSSWTWRLQGYHSLFGCVGKFVLYFDVKRWNSFLLFCLFQLSSEGPEGQIWELNNKNM